ncbi:AAA family ATPase [Acidiphilium iwatense]|uniref:AAA family ATPase n=1 Tax=Acidiphilium iwatense TaxID=768198 RepID=A0ABS9DVN5_9PROT|nr:AAA family ATPase [Acidiphilium iwatense]MCF3946806.1 AAA family ATPase [Acidiphilium iwatense]
MLIVVAGLPGTGKSTLAKAIAREREAVYLRIDTIEQAIRDANGVMGDVGPAGYVAAYALALDNLRLGRIVVADSTNRLMITRKAFRATALAAAASLIEIELICSDQAEHRRRVETRSIDIPGLSAPDWAGVGRQAAETEPWDRPPIRLDTAGRTIAESIAELSALIDRH